jgi:hypothetical protein
VLCALTPDTLETGDYALSLVHVQQMQSHFCPSVDGRNLAPPGHAYFKRLRHEAPHPLFKIGSKDCSSGARFRPLEQIRPVALSKPMLNRGHGENQNMFVKSGAKFCPSTVPYECCRVCFTSVSDWPWLLDRSRGFNDF